MYAHGEALFKEAVMIAVFAWTSYFVAEAFELSGIVAILFCGIVMAKYTRDNLSEEAKVLTTRQFKVSLGRALPGRSGGAPLAERSGGHRGGPDEDGLIGLEGGPAEGLVGCSVAQRPPHALSWSPGWSFLGNALRRRGLARTRALSCPPPPRA